MSQEFQRSQALQICTWSKRRSFSSFEGDRQIGVIIMYSLEPIEWYDEYGI
jgi:hypothetical protein